MTKHLTAGFDGSAPSKRAVVWAADEAQRTGAQLDIVSCFTAPGVVDPWYLAIPYDIDELRAEVAADVAIIGAQTRTSHPDVACHEKVVFGSALTELVKAAEGSDLLVVGTNGSGALESWLLGSVAHTVARSSSCPVVMVPNVEPAPTVGRIIVGVDDSATADEAIDWATDAADARGAELVIVHAWQYEYATEIGSRVGRDMVRVDAGLLLERALERSRDRGLGPVRTELVEGPAAEVLVKQAPDADLVVVGSRGRGGFRSTLFGSVAHAVAAHSSRPTVVIRDRSRT